MVEHLVVLVLWERERHRRARMRINGASVVASANFVRTLVKSAVLRSANAARSFIFKVIASVVIAVLQLKWNWSFLAPRTQTPYHGVDIQSGLCWCSI